MPVAHRAGLLNLAAGNQEADVGVPSPEWRKRLQRLSNIETEFTYTDDRVDDPHLGPLDRATGRLGNRGEFLGEARDIGRRKLEANGPLVPAPAREATACPRDKRMKINAWKAAS